MNSLSAMSLDQLTMTSREVAELTGKQHNHVMRDIRIMLVELHGEGGLSSFGSSYLNEQNKAQPCFRLPKRETLILVSGYNVQMRAKIIDRWQQLENSQPTVAPMQVLNNPAAMRGLLLTYTEKVLALEDKVLSLEPKSQALDRISGAFGTMNPTTAAKVLQIQPKRLFDWLRENHWIYRRAGGRGNVAYQNKIQAGYMTHKITTVQCDDGDKVIEQVLITAKGLAKLAMIFGVNLSAVHNDDSFSA